VEPDKNNLSMIKFFLTFAFLAAASSAVPTSAGTGILDRLTRSVHAATDKAPTTSIIENGFSPDGGAEALVLKVINASETSIRLAAYSFTSPAVVRALLDAKKRGVDVQIVVDD
jgi:phosphatidylserine/phosphatidylglycerophosphate/cardiolipin synthase-like enzyme